MSLLKYNFNITDAFFVVSILSITLGINEVGLLFVFYFFASHFQKLKIDKKIIYFFLLIFFSGVFMSLVSITIYNINSIYVEDILLRNRFFFIRILYALTIAIYLHRLSKHKILYLVYIIAMVNLMVGIGELSINIYEQEFARLNMVSLEPSEAVMFYAFACPLLLLYQNIDKPALIKVWSFMGLGLLILSKALFFVLIFWLLVYTIKTKNKLVLIPLLLAIAVPLYPYLFNIEQVQTIFHLMDVYLAEGIYGLNPDYQIWTSFSLRISAVLTSINILVDNFLIGIGYGLFHPLYIDYMTTTKLGVITGYEIRNILNNDMYATPKSSLFELAVSCGVFFIVPFAKKIYEFIISKSNFLIKISFFSLILVACMVELAPFLTYLAILLVLKNKT